MPTLARALGLDEARLGQALRTAIALCVALYVWARFQPPVGFYIPLTVMLVLMPAVGATYRQCMLRIVGVLLGGVISVAVVNLSRLGDVVFVLSFCSVLATLAYLGSSQGHAGSTRGYIFFTALVQVCFLVLPHVSAGAPFDISFVYRVVNTLVGLVIAMVAAALLFPQLTAPRLRAETASVREENRRALEALHARWLGEPVGADEGRLAALHAANTRWASLDELLGQAAAEEPRVHRFENAYRAWITLEVRQRTRLRELAERLAQGVENLGATARSSLDAAFRSLIDCSRAMPDGPEAAFDDREASRCIEEARNRLVDARENVGDAGVNSTRTVDDLAAILAGHEALLGARRRATSDARSTELRPLPIPADPARLRRAIAGGIGTLLALLLAWSLTLSQAVFVVLLGVWIAAFPQTRQQALGLTLALVISGLVAVGAVQALQVFYLPHVHRIDGLLLAVFPLALLFAYIGSAPRPPGALLQPVALIFAVALTMPGYAFQADLTPSYDLAKAILTGAPLGLLCHVVLWPADEALRVRQWASLLVGTCSRLVEPVRSGEPHDTQTTRGAHDGKLDRFAASVQLLIGNQLQLLARLPEAKQGGALGLIEAEQALCDRISAILEAPSAALPRDSGTLAAALGKVEAALRAETPSVLSSRLNGARRMLSQLGDGRADDRDILERVCEAAAHTSPAVD